MTKTPTIPDHLQTPAQRKNWLRRTWRELLVDQYEGCFNDEIACLRLYFEFPVNGFYGGPMAYDTPEMFDSVVFGILNWSPLRTGKEGPA